MVLPHIALLFVVVLVPFSTAQSSTSTSAASSTSSPTARPTTRSGTQTVTGNGTTTFPTTGTITLSANGTATATIVNGTAVNATSTPTSTAAEAFPTLGDVPPCVVGCLQTSVAGANCTSITDVACFCSSATFRNATVNCVETQCPSELTNAESLAQRFCTMVSVTLTFPAPTTASTSTPTPTSTSDGARVLRSPAALAASCALAAITWLTFGR